jgi:hypothetical protein
MKREPTAEERENIGSAIGGCKAGGGKGSAHAICRAVLGQRLMTTSARRRENRRC